MVTLGHHQYFVSRNTNSAYVHAHFLICRFVEHGHIGAAVRGTRSPESERQTITQETVGYADGSPTTGRGIRQSAHDRVGDPSEYITPVVGVNQRFSTQGARKKKRGGENIEFTLLKTVFSELFNNKKFNKFNYRFPTLVLTKRVFSSYTRIQIMYTGIDLLWVPI